MEVHRTYWGALHVPGSTVLIAVVAALAAAQVARALQIQVVDNILCSDERVVGSQMIPTGE